MTFKKGHKLGAKKIIKRQLDKDPTCLKLFLGHKEKLKAVDGWQAKVRTFIESLIEAEDSAPVP